MNQYVNQGLLNQIANMGQNIQQNIRSNEQFELQKQEAAQIAKGREQQFKLRELQIQREEANSLKEARQNELIEGYDPNVHNPKDYFAKDPELGQQYAQFEQSWDTLDSNQRKKIGGFYEDLGKSAAALEEIKDPKERYRVYQEEVLPKMKEKYPHLSREKLDDINQGNLGSKSRYWKNQSSFGLDLIKQRELQEAKNKGKGVEYQSKQAKQTADLQKAVAAGDMVTARRLMDEIEQEQLQTKATEQALVKGQEQDIADRVSDLFGFSEEGEDAPIMGSIPGYRDVEAFVKKRMKAGLSSHEAVKEIEANFDIKTGMFSDLPTEFIPKTGPAGTGQIRRVKNMTEARALPSGTVFIDPHGIERTKR